MKLSAFPYNSESENLLINFRPTVRVDGAPFGGCNNENVGKEGFCICVISCYMKL